MSDTPMCPGCGRAMELLTGSAIARDGRFMFEHRAVYVCKTCDWKAPLAHSCTGIRDAEEKARKLALKRSAPLEEQQERRDNS